ncbi:MAG TPA: hypothetical protein VHM91_16615, partial [Verrucomicrobiales bacterium]|nr:hypothetical protein [Verrucomicrobiales bacterium]
PEWRKSDRFKQQADLNADYEPLTGFGRIGNDEGLVRSLLLTVLAKTETAEKYAPYLNDQWLNALHAEARLLAGAADAQRWVSLLPPEAYQALKDRVDLQFDPATKEAWAPGDDVSLNLHVKNVPHLLVKVYEINTENVHRTTGAQVNTDLNLDGLTANSEQSHDYNDAPLLRQARTFQFPELKGKRGVWIVEFIGGGKSSRALIRKGGLRHVVENTSEGTVVRVFDESMKPVEKAWVLFGTHRYVPDGDGIRIPFSTQPGEQNVIIGDDSGFTTLEKVKIAGENYQLLAGVHVPRESLLPGTTAKVAIRPALLVNGVQAPLDAIKQVRLTISSRTLEGVPSSNVYDLPTLEKETGKVLLPGLASDAETVVEFAVPERLASLSFTLEGEVKSLVTGQPVKVTAGDSVNVNGISLTDQVSDLHLTNADGQFILEERGRTGEARPEREVNVTFHRPEFANAITQTLKTDASGSILLGKLDGISFISVRGATGLDRTFSIPRTWASLPAAVNVKAGEPVQLGWRGNSEPVAGDVSVLELRNGTPVRDASAGVAM